MNNVPNLMELAAEKERELDELAREMAAERERRPPQAALLSQLDELAREMAAERGMAAYVAARQRGFGVRTSPVPVGMTVEQAEFRYRESRRMPPGAAFGIEGNVIAIPAANVDWGEPPKTAPKKPAPPAPVVGKRSIRFDDE